MNLIFEFDLRQIEEAVLAKVTPGPWAVCGPQTPNMHWFVGLTIGAVDPDARRICDIFSIMKPPEPGSMAEANANFIAACHPRAIKRLIKIARVAEEMSAALARAQESINAKDALTLDMVRSARSAYRTAMWSEL